ncbi:MULTISPECIES: YbaL family putative K(+) efflux transporter [unclassified Mesorhizobium]|uniref:YbaL family putative K(+) efflux transporter n=1 Tax=unclassified Mesorhizobium TaxID=325217 RepID=UPI000FDB9DAE|nr:MULTISPECIES: YbaL family putative K(+) efflux transporter [unclassified Mesorhizobium]RWL46835.1 MAG: Kef family K(+) transporter [Mesorhizobium sp.]TGQ16049.1 Kef family K(+) transporter [Mesorhizobium sp. M2E.F.Ca.ET.219.01.1.1]TGS19342.1 Kef family K(+) transporter [Mesorhizobium sp. M2E.F.Ca.ET.209.01.1.1]TGT77855.1 Kef family K(+) transporter [Mesorhizobium sp. M2E.F.Ca.ET.166.01.1.1]TGW03965.1 Kef family K(+) transporter [Mesorhizobium sp. M2E.F.Ca.ET.154.01.1.1]
MPHDTPLIATIVAGLGLAFVFGALANRFRIPPLVGYLVAGVLVGPNTPGFVADASLANELAEIGVILLMFGVGLHFSLKDLLSVRAIAVPGAIVQIGFATLLGVGLAWLLGWSLGAGLVFGLALSVASTVVLLRALQERRLIETERGRIAVGWLIVEDLAMVLALVLLPALAGVLGGQPQVDDHTSLLSLPASYGIWGVVGITLAKVAAFVVVMLVVGRRVIPWILHYVAHTGSRELFRLSVLAIALGVAFGAAKLFGVSLALGAFFAGMIMSESELSHRAAEESLPLRDAFSVLFFVSVGMLFDPLSLISNGLPILATLAIIVVGKSLAAFVIVIAFRYPIATALMISASLAQIGEFSFILAELGVGLKLLPEQGRDLILAGAILSILLNPLMFLLVDWMKPWLEKRAGKTATPEEAKPIGPATEPGQVASVQATSGKEDGPPPMTALAGHSILIGYGRVGSLVGAALKEAALPFLVIEDADKTLAKLRDDGIETVAGNAANADVFAAANPEGAKRLILAIPNAFESGQIVLRARAANPAINIIARAHSDAEVEHLKGLGADTVIMGEREIARGIVEVVTGKPTDPAEPAMEINPRLA